jgi:hypothetical protein
LIAGAMPTISIFFGIVVQMYWRDHSPPHFHAYYQGREVLILIDTGEPYGGGLSPGAMRILKAWTNRHRDELMANWQRARLMQSLHAVPGADEE